MNHLGKEVWRRLLELRLRQSQGTSFQSFFSDVMEAAHESDFVRVKPHGRIGDKGCDGMLQSTGEVFACYGTENGKTPELSYLLGKMKDDANKAVTQLPVVKGWTFVHNMVDGLPVPALTTLEEIGKKHNVPTSIFGRERFASTVLALPDDRIRGLLGETITDYDVVDLDLTEVRDIVLKLPLAVIAPANLVPISPVSVEKLSYNKLPNWWEELIVVGLRNAAVVAEYFREHPDPMLGTRVAEALRQKYLGLREQKLAPEVILDEMYHFILGSLNCRGARQAAGLAVLGFFVESCDILEDVPKVVGE